MVPSTIYINNTLATNHVFLSWTHQDQLLMSLLISSFFSNEILLLIAGFTSFQEIWSTLESSLAFSSNTEIFQIHMQFQIFKHGYFSVTQFLHKAKSLFVELTVARKPLSIQDFNICLLHLVYLNVPQFI